MADVTRHEHRSTMRLVATRLSKLDDAVEMVHGRVDRIANRVTALGNLPVGARDIRELFALTEQLAMRIHALERESDGNKDLKALINRVANLEQELANQKKRLAEFRIEPAIPIELLKP